jgi:TrmH family RNA methyltransferase
MEITSSKNSKIKGLIALQKPKERRLHNSFIIEGIREISLAQQSQFEIISLFICESIYEQNKDYPIEITLAKENYSIPKKLFEKIAYRESTGGIIAIAKSKPTGLDKLTNKNNPLYLVLEKVEKPGNIGAMLRTADAAGIDGVIICDPATDFYNPNVIRSSVGCLFTVPVASTTNEELLDWLREHKITSYAAMLTATKKYYQCHFKTPTALLLGSESNGLSAYWNTHANEKIIIPMKGKIDSMNVSNAAAILIYEANRQREI